MVDGVWFRRVRKGEDVNGSRGESDGSRVAGKSARTRTGRCVRVQSVSTKR